MSRACIVFPHRAGLFSLLNNVVTCMLMYDQVYVDWVDTLYGTRADGNLWNHLFEPLPPVEGGCDIHATYPDQWLTYKNAAKLYEGGHEWRERCNRVWRKLKPRMEVRVGADIVLDDHRMMDFISVLVRAYSHGGEQVSGRSQSLDSYARAIDGALGPATHVFLMTRDLETLEWMKARFPVVYCKATKRTPTRDIDLHLAEPQTVDDAKQVMKEVILSSYGRALIHPVSNMATAALYMEPEMQSIYLP